MVKVAELLIFTYIGSVAVGLGIITMYTMIEESYLALGLR